MRPKVLHVTQSTGGVETSLVLLFRHFDRSRFEHHLACPPGTSLEASARELGLRVFPTEMVRGVHPVRDVMGLIALTRLMRRERYAVIHGHSAKGGYLGRLAARLAGVPTVLYSPRAFSYLSQRGMARAFFLGLERLAVRWTDLVVAASESERRRAIEEVGFLPARVVTVPNSIDFAELNSLQPAVPADPPVVLTMGRLSYQKNPQMFVRVAALVAKGRPDVHFVLAGAGFGGPLEPDIRELIRKLGLQSRLTLLPWVSKKHALRLVAECAVFVLTSRFEGMPNTVLEAMMLGKPVIATDVDGTRDVLGGDGLDVLVATDHDEAMAHRILRTLGDGAAAADLGRRCLERVRERFDIRQNVRVLDTLYERAVRSLRFDA